MNVSILGLAVFVVLAMPVTSLAEELASTLETQLHEAINQGRAAAELKAAANANEVGPSQKVREMWSLLAEIERLMEKRKDADAESRVRIFDEISDVRDELHEQMVGFAPAVKKNPELQDDAHKLLIKEAGLIREAIRLTQRDYRNLHKRLRRTSDLKDAARIEGQLADQKERTVELLKDSMLIAETRDKFGEDTSSTYEKLDTLLTKEADDSVTLLDELSVRINQATGVISTGKSEEVTRRIEFMRGRRDDEAASLRTVVDMLERRGKDTSVYRQKIIENTGEFTRDVLDVGVLHRLAGHWKTQVQSWVVNDSPAIVFKLFLLVLIMFFARVAQKVAIRLAKRSLVKTPFSQLAKEFLITAAGRGVLFIGFVAALSQLGIDMGAFIAGLGIAGFIVGFALQDTLSNFASGMMILVYRPYDVGDIIEVDSTLGKVSKMSMVSTHVTTLDNQRLIVPNNMIWQNVIRNITALRLRRVDLLFGIGYDDSFEEAEGVIQDVIHANDLIKTGEINPDLVPIVRLHELGDSSLNIVVRAWTETADYWDVYWHLLREVKKGFDAAGISIPFPQRDVHIIGPPGSAEAELDADK